MTNSIIFLNKTKTEKTLATTSLNFFLKHRITRNTRKINLTILLRPFRRYHGMNKLYYDESYKIVGAMYEVHKVLGCGFLEKVYQEALAEEFALRGIPFEREKSFMIKYKGKQLEQEYIADFVCYGKIIVELKAVTEIQDIHKAQVINYLKITGLKLGILVNFNDTIIEPLRLVNY